MRPDEIVNVEVIDRTALLHACNFIAVISLGVIGASWRHGNLAGAILAHMEPAIEASVQPVRGDAQA